MSKGKKRMLAGTLAILMAAGLCVTTPSSQAFAADTTSSVSTEESQMTDSENQTKEVVDLDSFTEAIPTDYSRPQQQPLQGRYEETVTEGRKIYLYMPEIAPLRARFTVIAAPAGVDPWEFAAENGWMDLADENGECLFILTAGEEGWGTAEEEADYVDAAMKVLTSATNHNSVSIFSTYGTFGVVGYEGGCAAIERWVLNYPLHIYAQVYINGESTDAEYYQEAEEYKYDQNFPGSRQITATQFENAFEILGLDIETDMATKADTPIPTWFNGFAEDAEGITFWMKANDCLEEADETGVYHQDISSDAWQTQYANKNIASWGGEYGLSQVKVTDAAEVSASDIFDFLSYYTNYTTACSYSNNLAPHMDYTEATLAAFESAKTGAKSEVTYTDFDGNLAAAQLWAMESTRVTYPDSNAEGTLYAGSMAVRDYDEDGINDPREFLIYVPDSAAQYEENGAPMVLVSPGRLQTAETFLDCSGWAPIANDEGCILVLVTQPYATSTTCAYEKAATTYSGDDAETANFARALMSYMKNDFSQDGISIDFTRVYASGHSAGSYCSQTLGLVSDSEWLAAIGSTSMITRSETLSDGIMPTYLICGHTDMNEARVDLVDDPWVTTTMYEGATGLNAWITRVMAKNGIEANFTSDDEDSFIASCSSTNLTGTRYLTYNFENEDGIEILKFGRTILREHNCYPEEFRLIWDYIEHFQVVTEADGTIHRYYSESVFTEDDKVMISEENAPVAQNITTIAKNGVISKAYGDKAFSLKAVTDGNGKLTYKSGNTKVATVSTKGKVTIKGTGKTTITITAAAADGYKKTSVKVTLKVVPAKATISKVASNKKAQLTVTVKKDSKATGYQIQVSTSKKFTKATTATLTKNSKTFTKLTAGKKYYVRARAYKTISGKKCYGAYSAVKSVKVKK